MTSSTMTAAKGAFRDRLERTGQQTGAPLRAFFLFLFFLPVKGVSIRKEVEQCVLFFAPPRNFPLQFYISFPFGSIRRLLFFFIWRHAHTCRLVRGRSSGTEPLEGATA